MRNQLVTELEQTAKLSLSKSKKVQPQESSLLHRAVNSLVAEHLEVCNYEYTLSVFLPESGLSRDKVGTSGCAPYAYYMYMLDEKLDKTQICMPIINYSSLHISSKDLYRHVFVLLSKNENL